MIQSITKVELDRKIANHQNNLNLPIDTDAVFVTRRHLQEFLRDLPQEHDAYKICFIRHQFRAPESRIIPARNDTTLTQLSLIFVPVKDTDIERWTATEAADPDGNIRTLQFCTPGIPDSNSTGHCPPASGCERTGGG